jgi:hypothetical protein
MSLVASYFAPVQNNPFGFLTRESFTSIGSTLYSTAGELKAEEKEKSSKADALFSNASCYVTFDKRGLTVYKDTDLLYTVPGIKTLKISKEGDKFFVYMNGINVSKQLKDPVQNNANDYYYFDNDGLTLTSYGDLIMMDKQVRSGVTKESKTFQTKNFSLARYYLAMTKKKINVSNYTSGPDMVPPGTTVFTWDTSNGDFRSTTTSRSVVAQSHNNIWAVLDITSKQRLIAGTSDRIDDITAIQWDLIELLNLDARYISKFSVKSDGFYVNDGIHPRDIRVNEQKLQNVTVMYLCLDGDLILCDNAGNMLWSLYVEAANKWMGSTEFIPDYDINKEYTTHVISAVNEYKTYSDEFVKAEANYKFVDSKDGKLRTTLYSTNSLSAIKLTGPDTDFKIFSSEMEKLNLTSGSVESVYEKLRANTSLKNIDTISNITNPVKFLRGTPSSGKAISEGNKLESKIKSLKEKRETINKITDSLVKSYSIPFPLIAIKGGTTNKNPATLLIKEARLYAGGSITDYTDVTGLIGAWASVVITDADKLASTKFISKEEWTDFIKAIHSKPSSTNTLKVTYELSGQQATISTASGSIIFGDGIKVNCKVDWSKCVNSSQKYEIIAYPFGGGEACPADLPVDKTRTCVDDPVNCVGSWGAFSACENGKQTKKYIVTTPAAYGGTPCLANGTPDYITQDCTVPTTTTTTPTTTTTYSDTKDDEEEDDKSFWEKYKWYVIGGGGGLFLVIIAVVLFFVLKKSPKAAT